MTPCMIFLQLGNELTKLDEKLRITESLVDQKVCHCA